MIETPAGRRELRPVEHRAVWITWGLALQAIGVGIPVTVALRRASQDGLLGSITHYTVRLVGHELLRSRADVALVILGVVVFVAGAVVLAEGRGVLLLRRDRLQGVCKHPAPEIDEEGVARCDD
jgi:uncharacterized membrane protein YczE